ncbi:MAG: cyclase [Gemmatimonadota bacterium]|jgi:heme-degrading monooxygenase HmoA
MILMAIKHQVADYDTWKKVYDTFPPTAGGALFHRVNRGTDDPNTVLVVAGFKSTDDARAFQNNAELKDKMQSAGIVGAPRFEMYEQLETSEA